MMERVATTAEESREERFAEFARTRDPLLRDELIAANLGLAHQLARRFANRGEPHDDLVQVASLALVKAVDRFDPERGASFSSFAVTSIVGEFEEALSGPGLGCTGAEAHPGALSRAGTPHRSAVPGARASAHHWRARYGLGHE